MGVLTVIEPDPFATQFRGLNSVIPAGSPGLVKASSFNNFEGVRRPVRGIQVKDDTYSLIQVRTADGRSIPLFDGGGTVETDGSSVLGFTNNYSNFLLQSVSEGRAEKAQVVQTFGEPFIFFYGEQPRVLNCQGVLLNTEDFNWRAEWWENYDRYLRGTACVQNRSRVYLAWDDIIVEGYMMSANAVEDSSQPYSVQFQFQIFLTNYINVSSIGDPNFPTESDAINLNPADLDTTGDGVGNLQSSTLLVRQLNQESFASNSLLQTLRDGLTFLVTASDEEGSVGGAALSFGVSIAFAGVGDLGSLLAGRIVRVPIGFAGGDVFDEVQLAAGSVGGRTIDLSSQLGEVAFSIYGEFPPKFEAGRYGLAISDNLDEYIARQIQPTGQPTPPPDIFAEQLNEDLNDIEPKIRAVFEEFGISVDPPSEAVAFAARAAFGAISIGIGVAIG